MSPHTSPFSTRQPGLLDRTLSLDALRWAWRRVRENKGAPGGDGVSLRRYETLLEANLLALADEVRAGVYRPGPVRRVFFHERGKLRRLSILPVRDRILQRAALEVLVPLVEPSFLHPPCSFGYRPGLSLHDAVEAIVRLRDRGFVWVVDADIRDCFGSLDHALLRSFVAQVVPDRAMRELVDRWVAGPPGKRGVVPARGIALGAVVSPLLCNIYLHHLDAGLRRRRLHSVRYADDFVVLCRSEVHAAWALRGVEKTLAGLNLTLNQTKTRVVSFDEGFDFLGVHFQGSDYSYVTDGKRIVVDDVPPEWFHYHAEGYGGE